MIRESPARAKGHNPRKDADQAGLRLLPSACVRVGPRIVFTHVDVRIHYRPIQ
jgi:hypothetical protein